MAVPTRSTVQIRRQSAIVGEIPTARYCAKPPELTHAGRKSNHPVAISDVEDERLHRRAMSHDRHLVRSDDQRRLVDD